MSEREAHAVGYEPAPARSEPALRGVEGGPATEPRSGQHERVQHRRWRELALRGGLWEIAGHAVSYGLRFISRTMLGALLFPAAFGMMEIINGLQFGLIMLSDVGIQQAVIQSKRGDDEAFLDTAFTLHVVRGLVLWLASCALALPVASITGEPELALMIPVASLNILILGFHSTSEFTLRRRLAPGRVVMMDAFVQAVAVIVTVAWAAWWPSVWALIGGGMVAACVRVLMTHGLARVVGHRNRFAWDASARAEIFEFGKWITGSSAVDFASMWGDRLLLVTFLGTAVSGVYATAVLIADTASGALHRVVHGVFYPLFSRVARDDRAQLRTVYYDMRLRVDALALGATGALAVLGPWVVHFLFDERYSDAGWMLSLLCVRAGFQCVIAPCESCFVALGKTRNNFYSNVARASWIVVMVPIGYLLGDATGVVWAAALSGIPSLLVLWPRFRAEGLLRIDRELLSWAFFGLGALLGAGIESLLPEATELRQLVREVLLGR